MSYQDVYKLWANHPNLDKELKKELADMSEKAIEDAFYTDIQFGTAGIRGLMGAGSNRINIHTIRKATQGYANYLNKHNLNNVAIGYDNRYNSRELAYDSAAILASNGISSYLFDSLRPTPELSFAVRYYHCAGGIMITASHNPKEYNGYKLYDDTGCQLIPELADAVSKEVNGISDPLAIVPKDDYDKSLIHIINKEVDEAYWQAVLSISLRKDLNKDFKIAFSPEHGASYIPVINTMKMAGYDVYEVKEQSTADPAFSKTKSPNPEQKEAYEGVLKLDNEIDADLFLVCDPDGDRMGVGVKHQGEYILLNGNQTGAVLLEYILRSRDELGIKVHNPVMFNTIVTSDIGEAVANYHHVECEKTLTGFKFIGNKVYQYEKSGLKTYVFGYEESYGSLISPFVRDKDATQACLMLAEACAYYREKGQTLYDALNDIFSKVGAFFDDQFSVSLPGADGAKKLKEIMANLRKESITIPDRTILKTEDYLLRKTVYQDGKEEELSGYDISDVLKYYLDDGSFVAIRPSGTEPKCKIYLSTKANTYQEAKDKAEAFKLHLKELIK